MHSGMYGMYALQEGVRQMRGTAPAQVSGAEISMVHGVGGILGTLLAGVFASDALGVFSGQGYNEGMDMISQVSVQVIGIIATFTYTAVVTYVLLKLVDKLLILRVDEEGEMRGLDLVEHDERGYDL